MIWYALLIGGVVAERLAELIETTRNRPWSLAHGGIEFGARHYPAMVALHTGLLAGCLLEPIVLHRTFIPALGWPMLAVVLAAQALRWWCIRGTYLAVIAEGVALPLVHTAWITAGAFTILNAMLLRARVASSV